LAPRSPLFRCLANPPWPVREVDRGSSVRDWVLRTTFVFFAPLDIDAVLERSLRKRRGGPSRIDVDTRVGLRFGYVIGMSRDFLRLPRFGLRQFGQKRHVTLIDKRDP
jgi:hypothetical protein